MNRAFRQKLAAMTLNPSIADHADILETLQLEFGHSVENVLSEHPIDKYTCGVHAFFLVDDPTYKEVSTFGLGKTFAGAEFISFILEHELLDLLDPTQCTRSDLIIYFEKGQFRHVGRLITKDRVLSKWGTGNLYKHGIWEIPSTYGDEIRFFKGPSKERCLDIFISFSEAKGFTFEEQKTSNQ